MELAELFRGRNFDIKASLRRLKELAEQEGLEFGERTKTYNSRLAQELGKWAETQPGGQGIHQLLYKAYFADGINLADVDQLVAIAESLGLDGNEARSILKERKFSEAVDKDWNRCRSLGITAVPTYLCDSQYLIGAQTQQALAELVISRGAEKKD